MNFSLGYIIILIQWGDKSLVGKLRGGNLPGEEDEQTLST